MTSYPVTLPLGSPDPLATLHHPNPALWEFEMHNGKDNRLTTDFLNTCLAISLDIVEMDWRLKTGEAGALIISGKHDQERFFSNGGEFEQVIRDNAFFPTVFSPILNRLLTFPIPTIAAINGHAFAAGFALSLACDYRVMQAARGWCCMNEVLFGAPMPYAWAALLNYKLPSPDIVREVALGAKRFTGKELHAIGVVDIIADNGEGVMKVARGLAARNGELARTGVWGLTKENLARSMLLVVNADYRQGIAPEDNEAYRRRSISYKL